MVVQYNTGRWASVESGLFAKVLSQIKLFAGMNESTTPILLLVQILNLFITLQIENVADGKLLNNISHITKTLALRFLNEQKCRTIQFSFQPMIWGKCFKKGNCQICCYLILHKFLQLEIGKSARVEWMKEDPTKVTQWQLIFWQDLEYVLSAGCRIYFGGKKMLTQYGNICRNAKSGWMEWM